MNALKNSDLASKNSISLLKQSDNQNVFSGCNGGVMEDEQTLTQMLSTQTSPKLIFQKAQMIQNQMLDKMILQQMQRMAKDNYLSFVGCGYFL